jgi:hypothetical protein
VSFFFSKIHTLSRTSFSVCSIVSRMDSDKGCTVDLVTSDVGDEFEFLAVLEPEEEGKTLADCITAAYQDNTFVRSF